LQPTYVGLFPLVVYYGYVRLFYVARSRYVVDLFVPRLFCLIYVYVACLLLFPFSFGRVYVYDLFVALILFCCCDVCCSFVYVYRCSRLALPLLFVVTLPVACLRCYVVVTVCYVTLICCLPTFTVDVRLLALDVGCGSFVAVCGCYVTLLRCCCCVCYVRCTVTFVYVLWCRLVVARSLFVPGCVTLRSFPNVCSIYHVAVYSLRLRLRCGLRYVCYVPGFTGLFVGWLFVVVTLYVCLRYGSYRSVPRYVRFVTFRCCCCC